MSQDALSALLSNQPFHLPGQPGEGDRLGEQSRRVCLCLHGLGGGPYEMRLLAPEIAAVGLAVEVIVYPGHDGPAPTRPAWAMPASTWPQWYGAAVAAYQRLAAEYDSVAIVGFSTGCPLALRLAAEFPQIDRLVLLSPFLALRPLPWLGDPARWLGWLHPPLASVPRGPLAIRDRDLRRAAEQVVSFRTFNLAAVASALELIAEVKPRLGTIAQPCLIVQPRGDSVVDPQGAQELFDRLGSRQKHLVWQEQSDHIIPLDLEREALFAQVGAFLSAAVSTAPKAAISPSSERFEP